MLIQINIKNSKNKINKMTHSIFSRKGILKGLAAAVIGSTLIGNGLVARAANDVPLDKPGVYDQEGYHPYVEGETPSGLLEPKDPKLVQELINDAINPKPSEQRTPLSPDYNLADFKSVYGEKEWNSLPNQNKKNLATDWTRLPLEQRKLSCEFYQSPENFKSKLAESTKNAVKRAYDAAFWMQKSENKKRITGESKSTGRIKVPIFRSNVDMKQIQEEYLQKHPDINPESLTDFYKNLSNTDLILLNELITYQGKRLNPEYLREQTVPYD